MSEGKNLLFISGLALIAWNDWKCRQIPNKILACLFFVRVFFLMIEINTASSEVAAGIESAVTGAVLGTVPWGICYILSQNQLGGGDVKLMAVVGMYLGETRIMEAMFCSLLYGGIYGLYVRSKNIPVTPFVLLGTLTIVCMGRLQ